VVGNNSDARADPLGRQAAVVRNRRTLAIAVGVATAVAAIVVVLPLIRGERKERLDLPDGSKFDTRIPSTVTVAVIDDHTIRLTFGSDQRTTRRPGRTEDAILQVGINSGRCKQGTSEPDHRLGTFIRKWGINATDSADRPIDIIEQAGRTSVQRHPQSTRQGTHIDLRPSRTIPKNVCAFAVTLVGGARHLADDHVSRTL
jgi:hypothetical protein